MSNELPAPDSGQLRQLVHGASERAIYKVLYESQGTALTMASIRQRMGLKSGEQEHLNRRMRELYRVFDIERTKQGNETLIGSSAGARRS